MRIVFFCLLLSLAAFCSADSALQQPTAAQLVEEAKHLMQESRNNEALGKYSEAIGVFV
jgi:hypothetical protein